MKKNASIRLILLVIGSILFTGCNDDPKKVCQDPSIVSDLQKNFSYEIYRDGKSQNILYSKIMPTRVMDSIVWCSADSTISGSIDEVVNILIHRYGIRKWRTIEEEIKAISLNTEDWHIRKYRDELSLLLILKYKDYINKNRIIKISSDVNYSVNRTKRKLVTVNYEKSYFTQVLNEISDVVVANSESIPNDYSLMTRVLSQR